MGPVWFLVFLLLAVFELLVYYQCWIISGVALVLLTVFFYQRFKLEQVLLFIGTILLFILYFYIQQVPPPQDHPPLENVVCEGIVKSRPITGDEYTRFIVRTDSSSVYSRNIQVNCYFNLPLEQGSRVRITGKLQKPSTPGNPGEFNYERYLYHQNIYYLLGVNEPGDIKIISAPKPLNKFMGDFRSRAAQVFVNTVGNDQAAILLGMLLGEKENIDPEQFEKFQQTGIVHLFAVSGLHVGFLLVLSNLVCSWLGWRARGKFLVGMGLMLLYGSLISWPVSVTRATIMASLALLAIYSGRQSHLLNSLGIAGIIIILINPRAIFQISFQLSFLATLGLVYLFPLLKQVRTWPYPRLVDLALIPICAQLAVTPVVAWYFNLFSPISLISNILITYLAGGAVICGFVALAAAGIIPLLATLILYPASWCIGIIIYLVNGLVKIPGAFLWVATPGIILLILYYAGILILCWGLTSKKGPRCILLASLIMLGIFTIVELLPASVYGRGIVEVTFLDVGQGDSILIKTPTGKFILIDGGGSQFVDTGMRVVLPYLRHRGIRELYLVVNTHPDIDHLKGLQSVLKVVPADYLGLPAPLLDQPCYEEMKHIAAEKKVRVIGLQAGQLVKVDNKMVLNILYPPAVNPGSSPNANSIAVEGGYRNFSFILPGDLDSNCLEQIKDGDLIKSALLVKVPHHGSRYSLSDSFYEEVSPRWAVIPVGNNQFGHPHPEVLDFLEQKDIRTFRTDQDGAVSFLSDGEQVQVTSFRNTAKN
ncbi:DNA internalization-related competence protein ComEC/Rec2 [Syntrophomonas erecta]